MDNESAIHDRRVEFVPETTRGQPPSDPAWELFSDRVQNIDWSPSPVYDVDRAVGTADALDADPGPEDHSLTLAYRLQRWLVDGSGNPQDAAGYGLLRDGDNQLHNSHTIVDREDRSTGGADGGGRRTYTVAVGALIGEVTLEGDPSTGNPITPELSYTAEKVRSYEVDQPASSTLLVVESTDANDTTQTLTVEDDGASTSEDVSLNGTSLVSTSSQFDSIDAARLDAETDGDVKIYVNDGSETSPTKGSLLMTINGKNSHDDREGDLGIPLLGSGSHASALGTSFERFIGDVINRGGSSIADTLTSLSLSVSNNLETEPQAGTLRRRIDEGVRDVTMSASTVGDGESHDRIVEAMIATAADIQWQLTGGNITLKSAVLDSPGGRQIQVGDAKVTQDNTFRATTDPAITIS